MNVRTVSRIRVAQHLSTVDRPFPLECATQCRWLAVKEARLRLTCNNRSRTRGIIQDASLIAARRGVQLPQHPRHPRCPRSSCATLRLHYAVCLHVHGDGKLSYNTTPLLRMSAAVTKFTSRVISESRRQFANRNPLKLKPPSPPRPARPECWD